MLKIIQNIGSRGSRNSGKENSSRKQVREYFWKDWYVSRYGEHLREGEGPFQHYLKEGWTRGFYPNPFFSPEWYLERHPDAAGTGSDPLTHWFESGRPAGYAVSPIFDAVGYLRTYADIAEAGLEPFLHYLQHGLPEGRTPGFPITDIGKRAAEAPRFDLSHALPHFVTPKAYVDEAWYRERYRANVAPGETAYDDYVRTGWRLGRQPNPFFSPAWYLAHHPEVAELDADPLLHWVVTGAALRKPPSPAFDPVRYLKQNEDIAKSGMEPFLHFVAHGAREGRAPAFERAELPNLRAKNPAFDWKSALLALPNYFDAPGNRGGVLRPIGAGDVHPLQGSTLDHVSADFLAERGQAADVISLDIWDTILRRNCHPDEIKLRTARALWLLGAAHGLSADHMGPGALLALRRAAEAAVANAEYEYRAEDAFAHWLGTIGLADPAARDAIVSALVEAELRAEIHSTRLDETLAVFLDRAAGRKLIAISDFYFGKAFLERLLEARDARAALSALFVSCDHMQTKRGGGLFSVVREHAVGNGLRWLHVGDNQRADYEVPTTIGIDAFHYRNTPEERAREWYDRAFRGLLEGDPGDHVARIRAALADAANTREETDELFDFGMTFAPVATAYALFAMEEALRNRADKVFFFTREGVFFRTLYEDLAASDVYDIGSYPEASQLHVSRRATFAASLRGIGADELLRMWGQYSRQSLGAFARSLNLDATLMAEAAAEVGLDPEEEIEAPWDSAELAALLAKPGVRAHIAEAFSTQRRELVRYLDASGFRGDAQARYTIVDIGWRGTIQDNLCYLSGARVHGVYLGLDRFINPQPANATKAGYLFDRNQQVDSGLRDYAPVEFLFNAPGGSVIGYRDGTPDTLIVDGEERVVAGAVARIQEGMRAGNAIVADHVRRHGLTSADLRDMANEMIAGLIAHPPRAVAEAFMQLEHNETFGAGHVQDMATQVVDLEKLKQAPAAGVHELVARGLGALRWPSAYLNQSQVQSEVAVLPIEKRLAFPRGTLFPAPSTLTRVGTDRMAIFCPAPIRGSGGHRTIYNVAKGLQSVGFKCHIYFDAPGDGLEVAEEIIGDANIPLSAHWDAGASADAAMATVHYSSKYVRDHFYDRVHRSFYLVQDFEAAFNPVGDTYVEAENSYTMGHTHVTIGNWLNHFLRTTYGAGAISTGLGVDDAIYHPLGTIAREPAIAFLYQPEKPRRMTRLAIEALGLVKQRRPDIRIELYGSNRKIDLPFEAKNHGIVLDLHELNRIYNRCTAGLCVSLTNPSRIPMEMMAAGCVPVDIFRYNNLFDYPDGAAKLAYQSPASVAEALLSLFKDPDETESRRAHGIDYMRPRTLEWEVDVAVNAVSWAMQAGQAEELPVARPLYTGAPVIAEADDTTAARAYCAAQARMGSA
ncbi:hypothetical protein HMH01_01075 [Halovulum dunhuangense]|uniref:WsaF C-terminal domain-containing protein n=1 Tax=Halovulum dunhuangense TaxID=1505036 RepID=A0A849KX55_9RHOB|nr:hypothetical protein [Halovulum dunhuangense]NNU79017.1 hypothetical protein [Halovulum dunhuangense]